MENDTIKLYKEIHDLQNKIKTLEEKIDKLSNKTNAYVSKPIISFPESKSDTSDNEEMKYYCENPY